MGRPGGEVPDVEGLKETAAGVVTAKDEVVVKDGAEVQGLEVLTLR